MDKEAFLHQLESSFANNDKKLFAKTIYDLPADVIVGFTKEEFSRIIYISHHFSSQKMDRLFNFLENKGFSYLENALKGIDELNNSLLSKFYYSLCISLYETNKEKVKRALVNNASICGKLAEIGVDSRENLENTVSLCGKARQIYPQKSADYAIALMNEGNAKLRLAEMGIDSKENLESTVSLCSDAQKILPETSTSYASVLNNKGNAKLRLAEMGIDSKENLENAVSLYRNCREIYSKKGEDHASALNNEGLARLRLADMGINSRVNLETSVNLCEAAQGIFPKSSINYALSLTNEGLARMKLAWMGIDSEENFNKSKKLYLECISILEKLGDGWTYSIALLNFNILLKENFYKTGNRKYLEEWERNLGNIEEKIKNREIIYKELLMARIHEIRASLLEFDGKSGINKASREYDKAYKLSKDPFYNFMDEFCQARIDTKSFCELVLDWNEIGKEGIFLDYYDYAVFECHLENALNSTINEEDELKLAVVKLTEIRDRTQIKIVKDRVSAYIHLLQALVDCFNNDSYKEAAENVKEGCKIFREYGDKQGQQMCEIFHNAVVKKRDPDAWQKIIRNRDFSSNFYSLLCEYSDRKRANLDDYQFGQVHEIMGAVSKDLKQVKEISIRTENKIDEIQSQIHSGLAEIKGQIEEGFDGTAAELRQIKVKIDNIEQDLDSLVQISNNVGGKEGECIREFASQMLELMKKGDYEALKRFSEKIVQNSSSIEEIIEAAEIPGKEKAEAKSKLAYFKKISGILKEKAKSFSVDVTKDVVVSLTSGEIIKLLTPVLSTAIFGVPIPSQIVGILLEAVRNA